MRIASIQDVSCYGQCSLTVALPILSAMGVETSILPTALLSTHTSGFKGFTFLDLSKENQAILDHWEKEKLSFDAVYTGYLGNSKDVDNALRLFSFTEGTVFMDPAFGDHGSLYGGFDLDYVHSLLPLVAKADVVLPNITEACFLLGIPYKESWAEEEALDLLSRLSALGPKKVILKGIRDEKTVSVYIYDEGNVTVYRHERAPHDFHGTGDIFASVFVGASLFGASPYVAVKLAADFVLSAIKNTVGDEAHGYGVKFEPLLGRLSSDLSLALEG